MSEKKLEYASNNAVAFSNPNFLFVQLYCPHCGYEITFTKEYLRKNILCTNSGCRRSIIVENLDEVLNDSVA